MAGQKSRIDAVLLLVRAVVEAIHYSRGEVVRPKSVHRGRIFDKTTLLCVGLKSPHGIVIQWLSQQTREAMAGLCAPFNP